ncbi:flotillin family protein [Streptomyces alkaliterrae]|uniref:Flotillin family protein n=1 Tax=Streptomyces alkaliterrae TaxID=2213162 RepID=A0A5P0YM65_9ACTN|nr:flotillin family protein [Streptomyces alkaliterrae]MBB1254021.1 flotillin family protein [Streptomyces alkaliterrae]MBB1257749.1 flotillin family protein [Streptomyces alkaliterrae]MQS01361.1 flotillin family protein [Streptomyces alkaliterrae]
MADISTGIGVLIAVCLLIALTLLLVVSRLFRKVPQGKALIVSKMRKVDVTFTGMVVLPVLHKAEVMDISVKTIDIARTGHDGLICKDNIRADIRISFFVRVNKTREDVVKVAQAIGTERASNQDTLQALFNAKFSEALKTVGKQLDFSDLYTHREEFRNQIIAVIGTDLNGYSLEDAAIDYLEQTPLSHLDKDNILDAQGIRKITELTAIEHIATNEFQRNEEKEITRQNVDAREAVLELERRQADAEIKQKREIDTVRAREEAETARVQAEERLRSHTAHIKTEEQLGIQNENREREVAVAKLNRERVEAIERERIEKDRLLEVIARERETELRRIAADKEVEAEKRDIADVVRERIAVEKTVAQQEEEIKKLRTVEEAERERQALIIAAEAQAQERLVKDIKAAEAAEQAAEHRAAEELTMAEARRKAAELDAQAAIRLAEGRKAEVAADGLAEAEVKERMADAISRTRQVEAAAAKDMGLAEAEAMREKLKAEADGLTEKAAAMAALDEASREHEEYRLRLDAEKEVRIAQIDVHRQIAESQATLVGAGLENANIDIVGGDSVFFDRLVGSITAGKSVDAFVSGSDTVQAMAGPWLDPKDSTFTRDLGAMVAGLGASGLRDLTLSGLLTRLIAAEGPNTGQLTALLDAVRGTPAADLPLTALVPTAPAALNGLPAQK